MRAEAPGLIALLGSGETGPTGGAVYELLARRARKPLRVAILETPAGFQPNSAQVAGKVANYMATRLRSYSPQVDTLPARQRGTPESPDNPEVTDLLCRANLIFLGPGSPTYAARQLAHSRAWHRLIGRHRRGAALATASAATIALSAWALPVYEIYKVGADLHWQAGLDLLGPYGLTLAFLPHWNNAEGGAELDTSHCFVGRARYERLIKLLPPGVTVVGIDEHTALVIDLEAGLAEVLGRGAVTIVREDEEIQVNRGETLALRELGPFQMPDLRSGVPPEVWDELDAMELSPEEPGPPDLALSLLEQRQAARERRDWAAADSLREQLAAHGWQVQDTPEGPRLVPGGSGRQPLVSRR